MSHAPSHSVAASQAYALPFDRHPYDTWIKQTRKLRWIGMEEEAQRLLCPSEEAMPSTSKARLTQGMVHCQAGAAYFLRHF